MKKLLTILVCAMLLAWPLVSFAATFKAGDSYSLGRDQAVTDDLYVAGGQVTISGTVTGDLVAASGNLSVTGAVAGDAILAGGTININGTLGDDVRIAGGNVSIDGTIADDLLIGGGQVHLTSSAVVRGDLVVGGGQVVIDGRIDGNVTVGSGEITIGDSAVIGGDLLYRSGKVATIASGARIAGTTTFKEIRRFERKDLMGPFIFFSFIAKMIWMAITAIILVLVFRTKAPRVAHEALGNFWQNVLRGFLVLVAVPVAVVIVCMTIVGIPIGVLVLFGYLAWLFIASIFAGVVFGSWLAKVLMKRSPAPVDWKSALLGTIAFLLVSSIPFVGWIVCLLFFLVALGAISKTWYENAWKNR